MTSEPAQHAELERRRYVTKPVEIEAILWSGGDNDDAVREFSVSSASYFWRKTGLGEAEVFDYLHDTWVKHFDGQYLIRGTKGELYPCDYEVFQQKYRPAHNDGPGGADA